MNIALQLPVTTAHPAAAASCSLLPLYPPKDPVSLHYLLTHSQILCVCLTMIWSTADF